MNKKKGKTYPQLKMIPVVELARKSKLFQSVEKIASHKDLRWGFKEENDLRCIRILMGEHARRKSSQESTELIKPNIN